MNSEKNIAQSFYEETAIETGFYILKFTNESSEIQYFKREVNLNYIQFHFCVKGQGELVFNNGNYTFPVLENHTVLLYNPKLELPIELALEPKSWLISIVLPIKMLHELFSREANYITFLSDENKERKYYRDTLQSPSMAIVLNQLLQFSLHPTVKPLYFKAKAYELLSLYFNTPQNLDIEKCPFLVDESNVSKIKKAKEIIIERMAEPPSLQDLASEIDLSLNKLKEGFKQIYGEPVYSFLFNYKMEVARQLLVSGSYNVNEVGLKVGYSTSSHFIAAFKKKFGVTPKKFVMSLTQ